MHPKPQQRHIHGSLPRAAPYNVAAGHPHQASGNFGSPVIAPSSLDRAKSKSPQPGMQRSNSLPTARVIQEKMEELGPARKKKGSLPRAISTNHVAQSIINSAPPIVLPPDHNPMAAATAIVANRKPVPITGPAPPGATSGPAGTHTPSGKAKTFKCDMCPQTFSRSHGEFCRLENLSCLSLKLIFPTFLPFSDLKRHVGIHTGVRPFSCEKCGRTFSRRDALARHHKQPCADDPEDHDDQHMGEAGGDSEMYS